MSQAVAASDPVTLTPAPDLPHDPVRKQPTLAAEEHDIPRLRLRRVLMANAKAGGADGSMLVPVTRSRTPPCDRSTSAAS